MRAECTGVSFVSLLTRWEKKLQEMLNVLIGRERALEAFEVISPAEARYINELTLHQDQWRSSQGPKNYT